MSRRIGVDHELVRLRPAHRARMRFHHHVVQPAAVEDAAINLVMLLVAHVEADGVQVEGVCVLHGELPHPQDRIWDAPRHEI